jgi:hypothetical protein
LDTKSTRPSYGASSSKIGMFQMIVTQKNMKYIPIACTTTNDVDLSRKTLPSFII